MSKQVQPAFFDLHVKGVDFVAKSKQVQPAFFDLHVKGVDFVAKAGSNLGGDSAPASWHGYFTSLNPLGTKP